MAARNSPGVLMSEISLEVPHGSMARRTLPSTRFPTTPTGCSRALGTPYMVRPPLHENDSLPATAYVYLTFTTR